MTCGRFRAAAAVRVVVRVAVCVVVVAAVAGCAVATPSAGPSAPATAGVPAWPDPVETCARLVGYWAGQEVATHGDLGLDYQEMGLSQGENAILLDVLPAARGLAARQGTSAVGPAATGWARARCRVYLAHASASARPGQWPQ